MVLYLKSEVVILKEEREVDLNFLCLLQPLSLSLMMFKRGLKFMKNKYFEDIIVKENINKKDLFSYLIENRIFIDSLSNDELKKYYRYLKSCYKNRIIEKIKSFFIKH